MPIEISLLGPVRATRDGRSVELGSPQQRALLALLALRAGTVTPVDSIVDALWPDEPPPTAGKVVQTYVSRLRKSLGRETIEQRDRGYVLRLPREAIDAARFEDLIAAGQPSEALALWRGPALAGLGPMSVRAEADRLEELRRRAVEDRLASDVTAGRYADAVAGARALLADDPLRERALEQLMLALYASGRHAEALDVYRQARRAFVDELGLEPGPALKELERRILTHDESLPQQAPDPVDSAARLERPRARRGRRRWLVEAAGVLAGLGAVAAALAFARDSSKPVVVKPNSVVRIDPETNAVVESIPVGRSPGAIAATEDAVWVVNDRDRTLARVDTDTKDVQTIGGLANVGLVAVDERGNVYVSGFDDPLVSQVDPKTLEIVRRYRVRSRAIGLAVGGGSLWVVDRLVNAVTRVDLATRRVEGSIPVGADPLFATFGYGALWVANSDAGTVSVVRPGFVRAETIDVVSRPFGIAAGEGGVWVASNSSPTVSRIDPETRRVVQNVSVIGRSGFGTGLFAVAAGAGAVWATNWDDLTVARIDPKTNRLVRKIHLPGTPRTVAVAGDAVWISLAEPGAD